LLSDFKVYMSTNATATPGGGVDHATKWTDPKVTSIFIILLDLPRASAHGTVERIRRSSPAGIARPGGYEVTDPVDRAMKRVLAHAVSAAVVTLCHAENLH
jgi:hypothetical protein